MSANVSKTNASTVGHSKTFKMIENAPCANALVTDPPATTIITADTINNADITERTMAMAFLRTNERDSRTSYSALSVSMMADIPADAVQSKKMIPNDNFEPAWAWLISLSVF